MSDNYTNNDKKYMQMAFKLAKKGKGTVSPNPLVGAVIVKNEVIIGTGFHQMAGKDHAETNAINNSKEPIKDAVLYINLEPCCHQGKTPACTNLLIKEKVYRVVIAMTDPNPLVAGKGVFELQEAGIKVEIGLLEEEAKKINEVYIKYIKKRIPYIIQKAAVTIDGKIATSRGDSKWITNEKSRQFVHKLRLEYDAIMVGVNTVLQDNPRLTCRIKRKIIKDPFKIIVDSKGSTPLNSKIFNSSCHKVIIATTEEIQKNRVKEYREKGAEVMILPQMDKKVNLLSLLKELGKKEICSILLEGGSLLNSSMIENGLVDKLLLFIAPKIIGGNKAINFIGDMGVELMQQAKILSLSKIKKFDNDLMVEYYFNGKREVCLQE